MLVRTVQFSELLAQSRWKVEFFVSDSSGSKSTAFPLVVLRDVLSERKETLDPQQYPDHVFNYLGLEHVQSVTGDLIESYRPRAGREVLSRSKVFRCGDLLYGRLRPSLNKAFVSDKEIIPEGICSGEFYVLTPDTTRLSSRFARELLASAYVQTIVNGMTTGSALPRLQLDDLLDIEVPLPPVDVQSRYEEELAERIRYRRQIATELGQGPVRQLDAFVTWLEGGGEPSFGQSVPRTTPQFERYRLPDGAQTASRGRGRPISSLSLFDGT